MRQHCGDSTASRHSWATGDPNTGLAGGQHFHLKITACSTHLVGKVTLVRVGSGTPTTPGGDWKLEIKAGVARVTVARERGTGNVTITYEHAAIGQEYRLRVENLMTGVTVVTSSTFTS